MSDYIATTQMQLKFRHPSQNGVLVVQTSPDAYCKADGANVYAGPITVNVTAFSGNSIASNGAGAIVLQPSAKQCKASSKPLLLEGDEGTATLIGNYPNGSYGATEVATLYVYKAGQTHSKGA